MVLSQYLKAIKKIKKKLSAATCGLTLLEAQGIRAALSDLGCPAGSSAIRETVQNEIVI